MDHNVYGVNKELIEYVKANVFPKYDLNDKGHGIIHIIEVIRRSCGSGKKYKNCCGKNA